MVWQAGQSLDRNRYTIQKKLGSGGFGVTYLVKDGKGREWVVKTLKDEVMNSEEHADYRDKYLRDFQAETLRLAICRHRHIVQIENSFTHENFPCILMEYVQGIDLWKRLKQQGALPEADALRYIQQIGEALIVVHDKGLLHRDLKPHNIMVRPGQDEAVLIDFGIAREFVPDLTQTHTFALTPGFAPIEQYDEQGHRGEYTDVYALAATFATLVTGSVPPPSFMRAVRDRFQLPTGVSAAVQKAIKAGMAVQPEDRPQSVEAWLELWQVSTPRVQTPARYQELDKLLQLGDLQGTEQETPFNRGNALEKLGRNEEAIASYDKALKIKPDYHLAWNGRGNALEKLGRYEEAIASYDKALKIKPDFHDARNNRDIVLRKLGRN